VLGRFVSADRVAPGATPPPRQTGDLRRTRAGSRAARNPTGRPKGASLAPAVGAPVRGAPCGPGVWSPCWPSKPAAGPQPVLLGGSPTAADTVTERRASAIW